MTFSRVREVLASHAHRRLQVYRHHYLLRGLLYSLDADSSCTGTTQTSKGQAYYRSTAKVGGRQVYYNSRVIESHLEEIIKELVVAPDDRPKLQRALQIWLDDMASDDEGSDLHQARARRERMQKKRKNLNRMAAEDLISWEDFKDLRTEIEAEDA